MIYALVTDYMGWACDSTVYQMILVIKFSSLAFDLYDGTYDKVFAWQCPEPSRLTLKKSSRPRPIPKRSTDTPFVRRLVFLHFLLCWTTLLTPTTLLAFLEVLPSSTEST